jgi:hypothetical protein
MSSETFSNVETQSSSFIPADTCKQTLSQSDDRVKKIQYAEFDESKWIPDEKCTSCRRKYLDPTPSHLASIHVLSVLSTLILFACGSLPITSLSLSTASLHSPFLELGVISLSGKSLFCSDLLSEISFSLL